MEEKKKQRVIIPFELRKRLDVVVPESERLWFVSDTHFGHSKLTTQCPQHFERTRKYATTEEMDSNIVEQWNLNINDSDTVVFLGDFIFGDFNGRGEEVAYELWNRLHGKKYFVHGNHDQKIKGKLFDVGDYAVVRWHGKVYICQHFPHGKEYQPDPTVLNALRESLDNKATVLVHGHTHSPDLYSCTGIRGFGLQNNVSWEALYGPVPAEKLYAADHVYHGKCLGHPVVGTV